MNRSDVVLVVVSVLGTAIAFALPLVSLLWRVFGLIADLKMQIAQNRHDLLMLTNQIEHLDQRWNSVSDQTIQRLDHAAGRLRGEVNQLNNEVRELQNYLAKTTNFEVRSSG